MIYANIFGRKLHFFVDFRPLYIYMRAKVAFFVDFRPLYIYNRAKVDDFCRFPPAIHHFLQILAVEHSCAALEQVVVGDLEVTCVPRVGDIAALAAPLHQQRDFAGSVLADEVSQQTEITAIHTDYMVVTGVVGTGDPACGVTGERYTVGGEGALGGRVDVVAGLLGGYGD